MENENILIEELIANFSEESVDFFVNDAAMIDTVSKAFLLCCG